MVRYKQFGLLILVIFPIAAFALSNYRASYDISVRGVSAGTLMHEAFFTDITYRIDTVARPSLAAQMLGYGEIRETVKGLLKNDLILPQNYQRTMKGDSDYQLNYIFHPKEDKIDVNHAGEEKVLSYDKDLHPLDSLSMVVQALKDTENHHSPTEYTLVMEDKIHTYQVQKLADQTWETRKGKSFAVHVYRQTSGNRQTVIYFADNPLRLVRLEQFKKGQKRFSMTLTDYQSLK
ncbi:DUF3108 domain-containing protein [Suttonella ornithocola]|uniref:Protein of uncharacterized function (DUF3108) n=1 Tax=Suttonella ornithocola TaxID=279832 RepID=A0A380N0G5_9GAMM|nr:DUF3108 domain-containing protein [Suttonella ornithocola]SUO97411.1 Protein of uncharacterised function (DUF3108) [Suttonella ornithocola]